MTTNKVIEILKAHNEWRRDKKSEVPQPMPYSPKELGEAIDVAVTELKRFENSLDLGKELTTNDGVYTLYAIPKEQ